MCQTVFWSGSATSWSLAVPERLPGNQHTPGSYWAQPRNSLAHNSCKTLMFLCFVFDIYCICLYKRIRFPFLRWPWKLNILQLNRTGLNNVLSTMLEASLNMYIFRHSGLIGIHGAVQKEVKTLITLSPTHSWPITVLSRCECRIVGFWKWQRWLCKAPLIHRQKGVWGGDSKSYPTSPFEYTHPKTQKTSE